MRLESDSGSCEQKKRRLSDEEPVMAQGNSTHEYSADTYSKSKSGE